jgi:DnaJ like chaperone protein
MKSNRPIGNIKRFFLIFLLLIPFILLFYLSQYPAPLTAISFLMVLVPLIFYTFQYYKMKIDGNFTHLFVSVFYIFIYYLAVTLLFIENIRLSLSILVIIYTVIHFVAYFIFIYLISGHKEWVIINGIFTKSIYTKKKYRMKFIYNVDIFKDIISMLTKIAKSDGVVSTAEASYISSIIDEFIEIYKINNGTKDDIIILRKELIFEYKSVKDNDKPIEKYSYSLAHHSHFQRVKVLQELINMAYIDGFTKDKEDMIYNIGSIFRFDKAQIYRYITGDIKDETLNDKLEYFNILGVKDSDSFEIVKKKYRKLVREYHPDKLMGMELSEDDILVAKEKMQELNDAYEAIKKEKRW